MSKPVVSRVGHVLVMEFESWHDLRMELFKESEKSMITFLMNLKGTMLHDR